MRSSTRPSTPAGAFRPPASSSRSRRGGPLTRRDARGRDRGSVRKGQEALGETTKDGEPVVRAAAVEAAGRLPVSEGRFIELARRGLRIRIRGFASERSGRWTTDRILP